MINHPGRHIKVYQVASIFTKAYVKAATIGNAVTGFEVTGVCPFNQDIFSELHFLPSNVTDVPFLTNHCSLEINEHPSTSVSLSTLAIDEPGTFPLKRYHLFYGHKTFNIAVEQNMEKFQTNSDIHSMNARHKHDLLQPSANLTDYQKGA
jgi:hypothetical protein